MTFRIDAGLSPSRFDRASVRDPTGSPVEMNVSTIAVRISRSRLPILGSAGIALNVYCLKSGGGRIASAPFLNYFRCRSLGFGSHSWSRLDSRNAAKCCQDEA